MTSLGNALASTIEIEIRNTVSPAVIAEQKRQARVRELNDTGARFFAKAKKYFTEGILSAIPTNTLQLQVGSDGWLRDIDIHQDIHAEMDWTDKDGHRYYCTGGPVPTSMSDPDRFAASWEDFKSWAAMHDLEAYWHLGAPFGPRAWWYLRVKPAVSSTTEQTAVMTA